MAGKASKVLGSAFVLGNGDKSPASQNEKRGFLFILFLKLIQYCSGSDFAEFAPIDGLYAGCGYAAIVKAILAQRIVKHRCFIFPFF